jgi:hypothetical protein
MDLVYLPLISKSTHPAAKPMQILISNFSNKVEIADVERAFHVLPASCG